MKKKLFFMLAGVIIVLLAFSTYALSAVWYVKLGGSDSNSGDSWTNAFATIQQAITTASVGVDQIWVMEGNYNITSSIQVNKLVAIYGGFPDSLPDPQWSDRNWQTNITTVDGNSASYATHCFVVTFDATIDGFTITNGGLGYSTEGGGIFNMNCNPTIRNCIFTGISEPAYGGALGNWNSSPIIDNCTFIGNSAEEGGAISSRGGSNATITNCTFDGNSAYSSGGAIYISDSSLMINNCTFSGNSAFGGGAISSGKSSNMITNCSFWANSAEGGGAAIAIWETSDTIINCTFWGNITTLGDGDALNGQMSNVTMTNCILWNDNPGHDEIHHIDAATTVVNYCNIQGGYSGTDNIDSDPLFVNPATGDFHLQSDSPCIDVGNNSAAGIPTFDFEGDPRIVDGDNDLTATVDMGADEYLPDTTPPVITLKGASTLVIVLDATYTDPGATATDDVDGDLTAFIVVGGDTVDTSASGSYTVTYDVSDTAGNPAAQVTRTVNVVDTTPDDTTPPEITLEGASTLVIEFGSSYTDPGATATDDVDGDLTASIVVGGDTVDISTLGSYTVTYNVSDTAGNPAAQVTRTVHVQDNTPPEITLTGDSIVTIEAGSTYTDAGATASDNYDGVITGSINPISNVDTSTVGSYTVTYYVSDSSGNSATPVVRTVNVEDTKAPYTSGYDPGIGATCAPIDTNIVVHVMDTGSGVDATKIKMTVEGEDVTQLISITGGPLDKTVTYVQPPPPSNDYFGYEQPINVTVDASDLEGNAMVQEEYSFLTAPQGGCINACQGDSDCDGILDVTEANIYNTDPNKRTLFVRPTKATGGYWAEFIQLFSQGAKTGFANVPPFTNANIEISIIGPDNVADSNIVKMNDIYYDPADPVQNPNNLPCDILEIVYRDGDDPQTQEPYYCAEAGQNHNYGHTYFSSISRTWYWDTKAYAVKLSESFTTYGYHYFNIYPYALDNYFSEGAYTSIAQNIGPETPTGGNPCPLESYKAGQCYYFDHSSPMNLNVNDHVKGLPDGTVEFNPITFNYDKTIKDVVVSPTGYEKPEVLMRVIAHEMGHAILEGDQTLDHCTNPQCIMYGNSVDWDMHNFGTGGNCNHDPDDIRKRIHNSSHY